MSRMTPVWTLVAAMAAATAQAAPASENDNRRSDRRALVNEQMRSAEVELYCDHQNQALNLMRDARRQLLAQRDDASHQQALEFDRAMWLVRHGDTAQAIAVLETARSASA